MNIDNARRILAELPDSAIVVDVGGGASPFPRANYVIDAASFDTLGSGSDGNIHASSLGPVRYSRETWVQVDLCDHRPWPFEDKKFDFAVCSHLLEDVRDPIWVCRELQRIARGGYIEVPSRVVEQSLGVENPRHAGYYHHRWLVTGEGNRLDFRHKPHCLHSFRDAIVARVTANRQINPAHAIVAFRWQDHFEAREVLEFSETRVIDELFSFAREARRLPNLTVPRALTFADRVRRHVFYSRLSRGKR